MIKRLILLVCLLSSCGKDESAQKPVKVPVERQKVRVAAIQCYSEMGKIAENRKLLTRLIRHAVKKGAKIIVLPEAAVSGYMHPEKNISWTKTKPLEGQLAVQDVAEKADGESVQYFQKLAKELKIYLTVPFIETDKENFYNSAVLVGPKGKVLAHHRKQDLWNHGDSSWCSEGDLPPAVVDTEYGRLGLMICYDVHSMPEKLAEAKTDIVLYSVGWYGPNTEDWYKNRFPRKHVIPHGFSVVAANWSHPADEPGWVGCGWSNIVYKNGIVIEITSRESGEYVVLADLKIE